MAQRRIHVGTVGLQIRIDMGTDITAATGYALTVKKPDGTSAAWVPTIGASTKFYYTTISGDLDQDGAYILQPGFTLGAWTGHGSPVRFSVVPALL